jgi:hypothetical protein
MRGSTTSCSRNEELTAHGTKGARLTLTRTADVDVDEGLAGPTGSGVAELDLGE